VSVLDELREILISTVELEYGHEPLCDFIADIFDDFEGQHPGLVDNTVACMECGAPLGHNHKSGAGLADVAAEQLPHEEWWTDQETGREFPPEPFFWLDHGVYDDLYCLNFCDTCYDKFAQQSWSVASLRELTERHLARKP
jgi:hypothetical protein